VERRPYGDTSGKWVISSGWYRALVPVIYPGLTN
jgi:hypothetical protein